jgi:hypothetical protein
MSVAFGYARPFPQIAGDGAVNKAQLKKFKTLLTEKRDEIVKKAKQTLEEDMALDANDLPDEMDLDEAETNARLATVHPDVAALRRYLVDAGLLSRAGGRYRRGPA